VAPYRPLLPTLPAKLQQVCVGFVPTSQHSMSGRARPAAVVRNPRATHACNRRTAREATRKPRIPRATESAQPGERPPEPTSAAEEQPLERLEQLLAAERLHLAAEAVALGDHHVVLERGVRRLDRVVELVADEDVVLLVRLGCGAQVLVDGPADR